MHSSLRSEIGKRAHLGQHRRVLCAARVLCLRPGARRARTRCAGVARGTLHPHNPQRLALFVHGQGTTRVSRTGAHVPRLAECVLADCDRWKRSEVMFRCVLPRRGVVRRWTSALFGLAITVRASLTLILGPASRSSMIEVCVFLRRRPTSSRCINDIQFRTSNCGTSIADWRVGRCCVRSAIIF
jgi:hypothetical protein